MFLADIPYIDTTSESEGEASHCDEHETTDSGNDNDYGEDQARGVKSAKSPHIVLVYQLLTGSTPRLKSGVLMGKQEAV